jgi:hypothetical protein
MSISAPRSWLGDLDGLLRGKRTMGEALRQGIIDAPLSRFIPFAIGLGACYGFFMGWFAYAGRAAEAWKQLVASTVKLPMLFLLTLFVTFPSLYVFNALVGCRLGFLAVLRLLVAAIVVNLAVAASLGPILAFFTLSTTSYAFMVILNVVLLAIGGGVGLGFLLKTLRRIEAEAMEQARSEAFLRVEALKEEAAARGDTPPSADLRAAAEVPATAVGSANGIFQIWVIIYALVGAQMAWLLRPFIGNPEMPFTWFRDRDLGGNFFGSVFNHIGRLFGM